MPKYSGWVTVEAQQWQPGANVDGVSNMGKVGELDARIGGYVINPGDWILTLPTGQKVLMAPADFDRIFLPPTTEKSLRGRKH